MLRKVWKGRNRNRRKNGKEQKAVSLIEAIHGVLIKAEASKKAIRSTIHRAQPLDKAYPLEVMSIMTNKRSRDEQIYKLSFLEKDLVGVNTPYNDALVLTVNINTWNVKRVLTFSTVLLKLCTKTFTIG